MEAIDVHTTNIDNDVDDFIIFCKVYVFIANCTISPMSHNILLNICVVIFLLYIKHLEKFAQIIVVNYKYCLSLCSIVHAMIPVFRL